MHVRIITRNLGSFQTTLEEGVTIESPFDMEPPYVHLMAEASGTPEAMEITTPITILKREIIAVEELL